MQAVRLIAIVISLITPGLLFGQALDDESKQKTVTELGQLLEAQYVFPDMGLALKNHLSKQLESGVYADIVHPTEFAKALTDDLQSVCNDLHLRVRFQQGPQAQRPQPTDAEIKQRLSNHNFGFNQVKRLPGNVGYLDLRGFVDAEFAADTAVAAMNFLAYSDALIIDLRKNGGGSPSMIQLICSYFFDEKVHLNNFYIREGDRTQEFWTHETVSGPRMSDTEIFVLTSSRTFSAAEEFSYDLKHLKRARLVGETTGGGAHPVNGHQLEGSPFMVTIPFGRAINPITGTNWEGTGVTPHVACQASEAFDKAYDLAIKRLLAKGDERLARVIETDFNRQGYEYLAEGHLLQAIDVFKKNVVFFPASANVYDSLGEAYMKHDQIDLAILNYKKSLELDPANNNAEMMLDQIKQREN